MLGKRLINSNSAAAGGSCTTDTLQILGDTSCIAYYKMSDATDESGNYDGTATNVNFNVAGKFGNAGEFNGSSSGITSSSLGTALNVSSLSFSLWFKTNLNDSTDRILISSYDGSGNARFYASLLNSGLSIVIYGSSSTYIQNFINTVTTGTWYHLSVTHTGTTTTVYLNGTAITPSSTTGTASAIRIAGSPQPLTMGQLQGSIGTYDLNGLIDNVRIFNKALSSNEVTTLNDEVYCVPTIVPTDYFNSVLYTGNNSTQSITGVGFQPDFTWIKARDNGSNNHALTDSVRGTGSGNGLSSNTTGAEGQYSAAFGYLSAFGTDGFTVQAGSTSPNFVNSSSANYVSWNWKAGGADVLNQEGTIDSQVSANVDAGFSIATFTGSGAINVGHGLNKAPELIIRKQLNGTGLWAVYSSAIGTGKYLRLNETQSVSTNAAVYSAVTDTTYTSDWSSTTYNWVSYHFHSVEGFSKIGSYTGNGNNAGTNVYTGFTPSWVMIKSSSTNDNGGGSWIIYDNKRNTSNPRDKRLYADTSIAEATNSNYDLNFLSDGFQPLNGASGGWGFNTLNVDYIFMAFAEEVYNPNGVTRNATNPFGDGSELALYKFEDNANDAEGSYNGTASNVTYATGYIDKAAVFNGSSSRITSGLTSGLTGSYSVSAWFTQDNISTDTAHRELISYMDADGSTGWWIGKHNNTSQWRILGVTGASLVTMTAQAGWNHIAVVKDSSTVYVYLNGLQVTSFTFPGYWNLGSGNTPQFNIGTQYNGTSEYWSGSIDQVRIFDRVLDSGEVTQLYNE